MTYHLPADPVHQPFSFLWLLGDMRAPFGGRLRRMRVPRVDRSTIGNYPRGIQQEVAMPDPRVGPVQRTQDDQKNFAGSGFVVYGDDGRPAAHFGFLSDADAQ